MISIGGIVGHFDLGPAPEPYLAQLRERYGPYTVPPADWVNRAFSLSVTFTPATAMAEAGAHAGVFAARPLRVDETDRAIRIGRWDFSARLDPTPTPSGRATWTGAVRCQLNPFAFDSLLRVLWAVFLPRAGGALFHACALRLDETGVIFPGQSGAGKSTLARKMPEPQRVLTDELVAVSRDELGRWRISGTPFWGDFKRGGGSIRTWPLVAISFLEQSDRVAAHALAPSEAALRLLGCFLCFQTDADTAARNLAIAADLCTDVRAAALETMRNTSIAEVEAALGPVLNRPPRRDRPPSSREMISELRWMLHQNGHYAFEPRGTSMRPWLREGDALFIESASETDLEPGDVVLYWTPGRTPDQDRLTCHRMIARVPAGRSAGGATQFKFYMKGDARSAIERFENGRQSEILGRVSAVARDGKAVPVPGRLGNLARLIGSLVATPILRMTGR